MRFTRRRFLGGAVAGALGGAGVYELVDRLAATPKRQAVPLARLPKEQHLLDLGLKPGPRIGEILKAVYELQMDGTVTTLEQGIDAAKRLI